MKNQSTAIGEIIEGNDPTHPDVATRERILNRALSSRNWTTVINRHLPSGKFVKFSVMLSDHKRVYNLEVFIYPNLADSARNRPNEKRIQITRSFSEHESEFMLDKTGQERCLLLGIYRLSDDDVVICAWDAAAYIGHANPTSCYVSLEAISDAFRVGFARSQDNKGRYVCCFKPEFIHYYIENMAYLHLVLDNEYEAIDSQSEDDFVDSASPTAINGGENVVFYGAPGTGKTHAVNELVGDDLCIRTVFHPDTQNSDFVGTLKPVMNGVQVTYSFSPGPFSIAFRDAIAHPDRKVFLVIEELNRAPAAAVFGELFLLLDRDSLGKGKYSVQFQTNEFRDWVSSSVGQDIYSITLPSNLWIIATMNSADQGVYPLDTAFRRRWQHIYVPIDYSLAPKGKIEIVRSDGSRALVDWCDFAKILNNHLIENLQVPEDRLLGPWFVSSDDLDDHGKIPSKVLIYLWDDLLRHHDKSILFDTNIVRMFGKLSSMVDHSEKIFSESFLINFPAEK